MGSLTDMFLRNRGRPGNRIETLQEKAARSVIHQLDEGQVVNIQLSDMIDTARARSWARESIDGNYARKAEKAYDQYWRTLKNVSGELEDGLPEAFETDVQHMHHLTDPETFRMFTKVKPEVERPPSLFQNYKTQEMEEFKEDGRYTDNIFRKFVEDRIGVSVHGITRHHAIARVSKELRISHTAALALLADLVKQFEGIYDIPALLSSAD